MRKSKIVIALILISSGLVALSLRQLWSRTSVDSASPSENFKTSAGKMVQRKFETRPVSVPLSGLGSSEDASDANAEQIVTDYKQYCSDLEHVKIAIDKLETEQELLRNQIQEGQYSEKAIAELNRLEGQLLTLQTARALCLRDEVLEMDEKQ